MGLFDPKWVKLLRIQLQMNASQIAQLERLRRAYQISDKDFATHIGMSPIGMRYLFESFIKTFQQKAPMQDHETIWGLAYVAMIGSFLGIKYQSGAYEDQLNRLMADNAERITTMFKAVNTLDDLVRYFIMEEGLYSDTLPQVRELYREIDILLGWNGYVAFAHTIPSTPKAPKTYTFYDAEELAPFATEITYRLSQRESPVIIAHDVGTRARKHPYQVILFMRDLIEAAKSKRP